MVGIKQHGGERAQPQTYTYTAAVIIHTFFIGLCSIFSCKGKLIRWSDSWCFSDENPLSTRCSFVGVLSCLNVVSPTLYLTCIGGTYRLAFTLAWRTSVNHLEIPFRIRTNISRNYTWFIHQLSNYISSASYYTVITTDCCCCALRIIWWSNKLLFLFLACIPPLFAVSWRWYYYKQCAIFYMRVCCCCCCCHQSLPRPQSSVYPNGR